MFMGRQAHTVEMQRAASEFGVCCSDATAGGERSDVALRPGSHLSGRGMGV